MLFQTSRTTKKRVKYVNKSQNGKEFRLQALVDLGCTHTGIDKQLVKEERIQTKPINRLFEILNIDRTKNEEVT